MADLVSVAVGGGIAAAAMWLQHRLKVREEWRSKQAEKYTELRAAIDEYRAWLKDIEKEADETGKMPQGAGPSPLPKVEDLCILYFPHLVSRAQHFGRFARLYEMKVRWPKKPLVERDEDEMDKWFDEYRRYSDAESKFDREVKEYAIRKLSRMSMAGRMLMKLRSMANERRVKRKKKAAQRAAITASTGAN